MKIGSLNERFNGNISRRKRSLRVFSFLSSLILLSLWFRLICILYPQLCNFSKKGLGFQIFHLVFCEPSSLVHFHFQYCIDQHFVALEEKNRLFFLEKLMLCDFCFQLWNFWDIHFAFVKSRCIIEAEPTD